MSFIKKRPCPKCGANANAIAFMGYTRDGGDPKFHRQPYFKCSKCQTYIAILEDEGVFIWDFNKRWILVVGKFVFR